jgi:carbon-monoxide dehydrogenase medium subunit
LTLHNGSDLPAVTYHRATGLGDAREQLRRDGAHVYAGGTDLVVALKQRRGWVSPVRHLVDIKDVREAQGIVRAGKNLRIGALATAREVAASSLVRRHARALSQAAALTSAPWIRARGTVGGNIFTPHPAGDITTALLALGAVAEFIDIDRRTIRVPLAELLTDESIVRKAILVAVHVQAAARSWYERLARRQAFCRASVAVAVVDGSHVAVAGLAPRPTLRTLLSPSPMIELVDALAERALRNAASGWSIE